MDRLIGTWGKVASGYDAYTFSNALGKAWLVVPLASFLEQRFGFTPQTPLVVAITGEIFVRYEHFYLDGELEGWGESLSLFATSEEGNRLLHEIVAEVESLANDLMEDGEKREEAYAKIRTLMR